MRRSIDEHDRAVYAVKGERRDGKYDGREEGGAEERF